MTRSSRRKNKARRALARIVEAMSEPDMARQIDEPIDQALNRYLAAHEMPGERNEFLAATADLVRELCQAESASQVRLGLDAAKDEAVYLIESQYRGTYVDGYEGALIDAAERRDLAPAMVWQELANIIKTRRRARYLAYVKAQFLDSLDWDTRLAIVEVLMTRCRPWLPPPLRSLPCEVVVDEILDLLLGDQAADTQLQQILLGPWGR